MIKNWKKFNESEEAVPKLETKNYALMDYINRDLIFAGSLQSIIDNLMIGWNDELKNGFVSTEDEDYIRLKTLVDEIKSCGLDYQKLSKIFYDKCDWKLYS